MEKIFDVGKKSYEPASVQPKRSSSYFIGMGFETLLDIVKVLILGFFYSLESFYHLFVPKAKKNVAGQVALVTGGGNGIGKQIALRLAREGCKIVIVDIERDAAIQTAEEIVQMNGQAKGYHLDVTNPSAVAKLQLDIENDFGPVDILVNNAALLPICSFMGGTVEQIKRVVDVNVNGVLLMSHTFLKTMMRRRKGHIVNIISLTSYHPIPGGTVYSATKSALRGFTESLYQELRVLGYDDCIHITGVHPYFVATRKDLMEAVVEGLRLPASNPDDVANGAVDGMLRNENVVCVPAFLFPVAVFRSMLPIKMQNAIRDHILKEHNFKSWQN